MQSLLNIIKCAIAVIAMLPVILFAPDPARPEGTGKVPEESSEQKLEAERKKAEDARLVSAKTLLAGKDVFGQHRQADELALIIRREPNAFFSAVRSGVIDSRALGLLEPQERGNIINALKENALAGVRISDVMTFVREANQAFRVPARQEGSPVWDPDNSYRLFAAAVGALADKIQQGEIPGHEAMADVTRAIGTLPALYDTSPTAYESPIVQDVGLVLSKLLAATAVQDKNPVARDIQKQVVSKVTADVLASRTFFDNFIKKENKPAQIIESILRNQMITEEDFVGTLTGAFARMAASGSRSDRTALRDSVLTALDALEKVNPAGKTLFDTWRYKLLDAPGVPWDFVSFGSWLALKLGGMADTSVADEMAVRDLRNLRELSDNLTGLTGALVIDRDVLRKNYVLAMIYADRLIGLGGAQLDLGGLIEQIAKRLGPDEIKEPDGWLRDRYLSMLQNAVAEEGATFSVEQSRWFRAIIARVEKIGAPGSMAKDQFNKLIADVTNRLAPLPIRVAQTPEQVGTTTASQMVTARSGISTKKPSTRTRPWRRVSIR